MNNKFVILIFLNYLNIFPQIKSLRFYPKISIITSIYKGEKFIKHFFEDIAKQTIFKECELILINALNISNYI